LVLLASVVLLSLGVIGVTGYFRLSSEAAALRSSLMKSVPGTWNRKIAVHVGGLTMAVLRHGLRFVNLPPEPRAAIEALHAAEAGVYQLQPERPCIDRGAIISATDKVMAARGWDRAVGVANEDDLVVVYLPRKGVSAEKMKCCLLVLHGETLVVASARGDLEPLMGIARDRLDLRREKHHLAQR